MSVTKLTIGIDEAGRGPWAGPLAAAAVALDPNTEIYGLNDSKKLSAKRRELLFHDVAVSAVSAGIGWATPGELDRLGLGRATELAMRRALTQIDTKNCEIIIDGSINYLKDTPNTQAVVKADGSVPAVSAASIVAKYLRDLYMLQLAKSYPEYGFELHKGYGTAVHKQALESFGACLLHRRSFAPVKAYIQGD